MFLRIITIITRRSTYKKKRAKLYKFDFDIRSRTVLPHQNLPSSLLAFARDFINVEYGHLQWQNLGFFSYSLLQDFTPVSNFIRID